MIAQVTLTPTECKLLIAKGIACHPTVLRAAEQGTIALHPSSSTYFIVRELTGRLPPEGVWVVGVVAARGTCVEATTQPARDPASNLLRSLQKPAEFPHTWIIRRGALESSQYLGELLRLLGPSDVYIKGVNAIDAQGWLGVLRASLAEGTIGLVLAAAKTRGFATLFPVGYEKLVPTRLSEAARVSLRPKDYAMGCPVNLFAFQGESMTEVDSFRLLAGVEATVIASGGLGGSEGALTFLLTGEKMQVEHAISLAEQVKGVQLPQLKLPDCRVCSVASCTYPGWEKPWFN